MKKFKIFRDKDLERLKSKDIFLWNSYDRWICFKLYYRKQHGVIFKHSQNYGLNLILLKNIKLSNEDFLRYMKWLSSNNKLNNFWSIKNNLNYYKQMKGLV